MSEGKKKNNKPQKEPKKKSRVDTLQKREKKGRKTENLRDLISMMQMEKSMIVHLLHSIPHINVSLHFVNSTFDLNSPVYREVRFTHRD